MKTKRTNRPKQRLNLRSRIKHPIEHELELNCLRLKSSVFELRKEIKLYRDTLAKIRDLALFGKVHGEGKTVASRTSLGRCVEINNLAFRAFNWRDLEAKEEVRELAKLYGLCQ